MSPDNLKLLIVIVGRAMNWRQPVFLSFFFSQDMGTLAIGIAIQRYNEHHWT